MSDSQFGCLTFLFLHQMHSPILLPHFCGNSSTDLRATSAALSCTVRGSKGGEAVAQPLRPTIRVCGVRCKLLLGIGHAAAYVAYHRAI